MSISFFLLHDLKLCHDLKSKKDKADEGRRHHLQRKHHLPLQRRHHLPFHRPRWWHDGWIWFWWLFSYRRIKAVKCFFTEVIEQGFVGQHSNQQNIIW